MTSPTVNTSFTFTSMMTGNTSGIEIIPDLRIDKNITFGQYNCATFSNNGKLTTNSNGSVICADDSSSSTTVTANSPLQAINNNVSIRDSTGTGSVTLNNTPIMTNVTSQGTFTAEQTNGTDIMTVATGGIKVTGDQEITNSLRLSAKNCSGFTNGGKLTTDSSGFVNCGNDVSGSSSTTITATRPLDVSGGTNVFIADKTGTGSIVLNSSPTMTSPTINTSFTFTSMMTGNTGGVEISTDLKSDKNLTLGQYNCSTFSNGGKLTANSNGSVICQDDNNTITSVTASSPLQAINNNVSIRDSTGSGSVVLNNSPTMTSPTINTTFTFSAGGNVMTGAVGGIQVSGDENITGRLHNGTANYVLDTRNINTTSPITGGGNLTADRTIAIPKATTSVDGYLAATDFNTFNNKIGSVTATTPLDVSGGNNVFIKDKTGSASVVLNNSPTMTSPTVNTSFTFTSMMTGLTSGIEVTPDIQLDKNVRFNQYNCSGFNNSGKLTVNSAGSVICADDSSSSTTITATSPLQAINGNISIRDSTGTASVVLNNSPTMTSVTVNTSLSVVGTSDTNEFFVRGNSTQTSDIFEILRSDSTKIMTANTNQILLNMPTTAAGGMTTPTIYGGLSPSSNLDLYANTQPFNEGNAGRIRMFERLYLLPSTTQSFSAARSLIEIPNSTTFTLNAGSVIGYLFAPTILYTSGPAFGVPNFMFFAQPTVKPSGANITVGQFTSFYSNPTMTADTKILTVADVSGAFNDAPTYSTASGGTFGAGSTHNSFYSTFAVNSGIIDTRRGLFVKNGLGGGTLNNQYGVYLENMTKGATLNYAIYSLGGTSYLAGNLGIGDSAPTAPLTVNGHIHTMQTAPTVANNDCGTTVQGTITTKSTDVSGQVTVGTLAVTACNVSFNTTWTNAPFCVVSDDTNIIALKASATTTKLTITSVASMSSDKVSWVCLGNE